MSIRVKKEIAPFYWGYFHEGACDTAHSLRRQIPSLHTSGVNVKSVSRFFCTSLSFPNKTKARNWQQFAAPGSTPCLAGVSKEIRNRSGAIQFPGNETVVDLSTSTRVPVPISHKNKSEYNESRKAAVERRTKILKIAVSRASEVNFIT